MSNMEKQLELFWDMFDTKEELLEFLTEQLEEKEGSGKKAIQQMLDTVKFMGKQ